MCIEDETRRSSYQQTYFNILQARVAIEKGDYPFATELARDTTLIMREMRSYVNIPDIESMYSNIKIRELTSGRRISR